MNDFRHIDGPNPNYYYKDEMRDFGQPPFRAPNFPIHDAHDIPSHNYGRHTVAQPRIATLRPVKQPKNWRMIIIAIFSVVVVGIALFAVVMSFANKTASVTTVQQPQSAGEVANQLGCTGFTELNPGSSGMVVTAGTCAKDGTKYAIDTFASQTVRDTWLQAAEKLGVVPKWETATSVTYKSVSS